MSRLLALLYILNEASYAASKTYFKFRRTWKKIFPLLSSLAIEEIQMNELTTSSDHMGFEIDIIIIIIITVKIVENKHMRRSNTNEILVYLIYIFSKVYF